MCKKLTIRPSYTLLLLRCICIIELSFRFLSFSRPQFFVSILLLSVRVVWCIYAEVAPVDFGQTCFIPGP